MEGFVLPGTLLFKYLYMFHIEQYQHNKNFAKIGQNIAISYLLSKRYTINKQNFRLHNDEIDIIAYKNKEICFIEVKTRLSENYDKAEYHISARKLYYMKRSAQRFCQAHNIPEELIRLEALAITLNISKKIANIKHFLRVI